MSNDGFVYLVEALDLAFSDGKSLTNDITKYVCETLKTIFNVSLLFDRKIMAEVCLPSLNFFFDSYLTID